MVSSRNAEGECKRAAGEADLAAKNYEKSLEHFRNAVRLLGQDEVPFRNRIVDAMLADLRGLFAANSGPVHPLVGRLFSPELGGGLFAASYALHGALDNPQVTINPLTALTPGFLRGLFGNF